MSEQLHETATIFNATKGTIHLENQKRKAPSMSSRAVPCMEMRQLSSASEFQ